MKLVIRQLRSCSVQLLIKELWKGLNVSSFSDTAATGSIAPLKPLLGKTYTISHLLDDRGEKVARSHKITCRMWSLSRQIMLGFKSSISP